MSCFGWVLTCFSRFPHLHQPSHQHTCFSLQRSVVAAFSAPATEKAQLDIVSQQWWVGRLLLVALSMGMQKIPVIVLLGMFKVEHVR